MQRKNEYLRNIFRLTDRGDTATTTSEIANALEISDASASETIKNLEEKNLICRVPYKGITLSPPGKEKAKNATEKYEKLVDFFKKIGAEKPEAEAKRASGLPLDTIKKMEESVE